MGFAQNLKSLLDHKGIKQVQLIEKLGITKTRMSNYLSGRSQPDYDTLVRILDILDVSADMLLGYKTSSEDAPLIFDYGFPKIIPTYPENDEKYYIPVYMSSNEPVTEVKPCGYIRQHYFQPLLGYYALIIADDNLMAPDIKKWDTVYIKPCKEIAPFTENGKNPIYTFALNKNDHVGISLRRCIFKKNQIVCINSLHSDYLEIYYTQDNNIPVRGIVTGIWRSYTYNTFK